MIKQNSPEWKSERLGVLTSTRAASLMGTKGARETLMAEIICEIVTAKSKVGVKTPSMERGLSIESEAVSYYELMYNEKVTDTDSYIVSSIHPLIADSPGGLIGSVGGLEIKNLDRHNHLKVLLSDQPERKYEHQINWHLLVNENCEGWDYFGYCNELPEPLRSYRRRYERDMEIMMEYHNKAMKFIEELEQNLKRYDLSLEIT